MIGESHSARLSYFLSGKRHPKPRGDVFARLALVSIRYRNGWIQRAGRVGDWPCAGTAGGRWPKPAALSKGMSAARPSKTIA